jgi:hypothetical protein
MVKEDRVTILLLSSKPENKMGSFNTTSLAIVLNRIMDIDKDYDELDTWCQIEDNILKIVIDVVPEIGTSL